MRLCDRIEVGGVELFIEIGATGVGETVEAAVNTLNETVSTEFAKATASVIPGGIDAGDLAVTRDSSRSHVALLAEDLKNAVVSRLSHPVRVPSHLVLSCGRCAHSNTDVTTDSSHSPLGIRSIDSIIQLLAGKD